MKNLHILPTSEPSKLYYHSELKQLEKKKNVRDKKYRF